MARLEPLALDQVDPSLQEVVHQAQERLPQFMNQVLTLAHHPRIARDLVTLYLGFQEESRVERRLIELAVLTVSHLNRCVYCVSHHTPLGEQAGLSPGALADLRAGRAAESPHLSPLEKLVVAYAEQVTRDARRVPRSLWAELQTHFDEAQLVELTVRIALANFFNRLNDALQIDLEPGVDALL
ncbi:carboxymuconolactone decarboxylase family protein [Litorilinea aerophila]|uniref:Carboxymuconolactone decarboxylase family protein n=1 Tax=Litorilinea aerophila TaxID=1204385 RepID=A0A540VIL4_9CHLR|nr:carboxymuconolactone decarboxylase family protein [Litorilinea aerophila]MCC9075768.1 carboxymuconolactone decarboxylase family protein [Litorilinea aerophila]GIV77304.1 MAG: alkyl hydroperoxide reductase AhpD [Litorilinea sp.]